MAITKDKAKIIAQGVAVGIRAHGAGSFGTLGYTKDESVLKFTPLTTSLEQGLEHQLGYESVYEVELAQVDSDTTISDLEAFINSEVDIELTGDTDTVTLSKYSFAMSMDSKLTHKEPRTIKIMAKRHCNSISDAMAIA